MATNYNITDFNDIVFNPLPYGDPNSNQKHNALIIFDNGYSGSISQNKTLDGTITYNLSAVKNSVSEFNYVRLSENEITTKLLEIQNL